MCDLTADPGEAFRTNMLVDPDCDAVPPNNRIEQHMLRKSCAGACFDKSWGESASSMSHEIS